MKQFELPLYRNYYGYKSLGVKVLKVWLNNHFGNLRVLVKQEYWLNLFRH